MDLSLRDLDPKIESCCGQLCSLVEQPHGRVNTRFSMIHTFFLTLNFDGSDGLLGNSQVLSAGKPFIDSHPFRVNLLLSHADIPHLGFPAPPSYIRPRLRPRLLAFDFDFLSPYLPFSVDDSEPVTWSLSRPCAIRPIPLENFMLMISCVIGLLYRAGLTCRIVVVDTKLIDCTTTCRYTCRYPPIPMRTGIPTGTCDPQVFDPQIRVIRGKKSSRVRV